MNMLRDRRLPAPARLLAAVAIGVWQIAGVTDRAADVVMAAANAINDAGHRVMEAAGRLGDWLEARR